MRIQGLLILFISLACIQTAVAQDNTSYTDKLINLPARFNERMQKKTEKLEEQLTRKEEKLRNKLMKTDSTAAKQLFDGSAEQNAKLEEQLRSPSTRRGPGLAAKWPGRHQQNNFPEEQNIQKNKSATAVGYTQLSAATPDTGR